MLKLFNSKAGVSPHLHKVPRVHLFQRDLQVQNDVISSGDVPVLLLSVAAEHEPKVTKKATEEGREASVNSPKNGHYVNHLTEFSIKWSWEHETNLENISLWELWWPSLSPSSPYMSYCFLFSSSERTYKQSYNTCILHCLHSHFRCVESILKPKCKMQFFSCFFL